jgi:hypothetical protein
MKTSFPIIPITFALVCFALVQNTQAISPPPDGGYGNGNTAEGTNALFSVNGGIWNTALGSQALFNDSGDQNTATGFQALLSNTIGSKNTAYGVQALYNNTTGFSNEASGFRALYSNTFGLYNTGIGFYALLHNTIGEANTATGASALWQNTTGFSNTAIGSGALGRNTTGGINTALGIDAGNNITTANNVICIGHPGADVDDTTWIGNVYGVTTASGTALPVVVSDQGQLGTTPSAARFKKEIKPMDTLSESILALKPVTFHYKSDKANTPQFGLIAEEVAEVNPDLVVRDEEGKPYSVRYDQVNAMLLNEFLKEHRTVQELQATLAEQQKSFESKLACEQKQIDALTGGLQKVSAQLEVRKPAPQTVLNSQ